MRKKTKKVKKKTKTKRKRREVNGYYIPGDGTIQVLYKEER
jgi:hypothetical protein